MNILVDKYTHQAANPFTIKLKINSCGVLLRYPGLCQKMGSSYAGNAKVDRNSYRALCLCSTPGRERGTGGQQKDRPPGGLLPELRRKVRKAVKAGGFILRSKGLNRIEFGRR